MPNNDDDLLLKSKKGNTLTNSEWEAIKSKGIWSDPQEYLNYVDGWAKPNATVQNKISDDLYIGIGTDRMSFPRQDVISYLQDKNQPIQSSRTDWNFDNNADLQSKLDYDIRKDGDNLQYIKQFLLKKKQLNDINSPSNMAAKTMVNKNIAPVQLPDENIKMAALQNIKF